MFYWLFKNIKNHTIYIIGTSFILYSTGHKIIWFSELILFKTSRENNLS